MASQLPFTQTEDGLQELTQRLEAALAQADKLEKRLAKQEKAALKEKNALLEQVNAQQMMLEQSTNYLMSTRAALKEEHDNVMESIQYARYIQNAILPDWQLMSQRVPQSFIFYQPKDIISGDLPWFRPLNEGDFLIAAIDCTGHGVPGALLTMLGYALLNEIVARQATAEPGELLEMLDTEIKKSFRRHVGLQSVDDGMDVSLCRIQPAKQLLSYAGARRPLTIVHADEVLELHPGEHSIGSRILETNAYVNQTYSLQPGDRIYLYSDGFTDQFGGSKGKKFLKQRFQGLLLTLKDTPLAEQQQAFSTALNQWRGSNPQTDDVLVMGLQLS